MFQLDIESAMRLCSQQLHLAPFDPLVIISTNVPSNYKVNRQNLVIRIIRNAAHILFSDFPYVRASLQWRWHARQKCARLSELVPAAAVRRLVTVRHHPASQPQNNIQSQLAPAAVAKRWQIFRE